MIQINSKDESLKMTGTADALGAELALAIQTYYKTLAKDYGDSVAKKMLKKVLTLALEGEK